MPDRPDAPRRAWQRMLSGRRLDLLDPSPLDVEIEDIAHGLARVARWNGQTLGPHAFSVAQHSLFVEALAAAAEPALSPRERLGALLHDAPEYVIGDMISPFKAVIGGTYKDVERRLSDAVRMRFQLPPLEGSPLGRLVKAADLVAAHFEATRLAGFTEREARRYFGRTGLGADQRLIEAVADTCLTPWKTAVAEDRFLEVFHALDGSAAA